MEDAIDLISRSFTAVSTLQGVIIALFAAFLMTRYTRILFISILAILADQFIAVLMEAYDGGDRDDLWEAFMDAAADIEVDVAVTRFVGYLVLITVFYMAKTVVFRRQ